MLTYECHVCGRQHESVKGQVRICQETIPQHLRITAKELRATCIPVPDDIPDCAWILREDYLSAMSRMTTDVKTISRKDCTFDVTHSLQLPPFYWISVKGTVTI